MILYLVRHGQSEGNVKRYFHGQTDYPLTEKGHEQAREVAEKLKDAKAESDRIIKNAVGIANDREKEILAEAKQKADGIVRQAESDAILERKKAEDGIRKEIVEVSAALTEKMLEREVSADDHKRFIDSFIESIGDE